MTTYVHKMTEQDRKWFLIDAKGQVLGRLASAAASILTGKRKAIYTPFLDTGDHVIVINAAQVHLTGRKETDPNVFYEVKYRMPDGIVFDLTETGWKGATKEVAPASNPTVAV